MKRLKKMFFFKNNIQSANMTSMSINDFAMFVDYVVVLMGSLPILIMKKHPTTNSFEDSRKKKLFHFCRMNIRREKVH